MSEIPIVVAVIAGSGSDGLGVAEGAPIAGGTVEAARTEPPREIRSATTDDEGIARLSVPGPGSYFLSLTHNTEGGAFVGDSRIDVGDAGEDGRRFELEGRAVAT